MSDRTVAACLTPSGSAALATIAITGPDSWTIARKLYQPIGSLALPETMPGPSRFWFGRFGAEILDEVVLTVSRSVPPTVEIHCHGGRRMVAELLHAIQGQGADIVDWSEFLRETNPSEHAHALEVLARTRTARTARIMLDQLHGAYSAAIHEIAPQLRQGNTEAARRLLEQIRGRIELGRHLATPWRVVVAGAPNVGKSSLINALLGFQRSIVSPTPGTTRDVSTAVAAIDGWPVEFRDTAGIRQADDPLEQAGVSLAEFEIRQAELVLWVVDTTVEPVLPPINAPVQKMLLVANKIDAPAVWARERLPKAVFVSAQTGEGVHDLETAISEHLVPCPPYPGCAVPFLSSQVDALEACCEALTLGHDRKALELLSGPP